MVSTDLPSSPGPPCLHHVKAQAGGKRPELVYSQPDSRREIYLLALDAPSELPGSLAGIEPRFAALLVWDADQESVSTISAVTEFLFRAGCISLSTWGRDCERVHDIMDEVSEWLEIDEGPNRHLQNPEDAEVTTWHSESFRSALFYLACCAHEPGSYAPCAQSIVITIGTDESRRMHIRKALEWPFECPRRRSEGSAQGW